MKHVSVSREMFAVDRQGRTFADVLNDPAQPMASVFEFFNSPDRQRRMEEAEIHHDRPPLAGVVRELEAIPEVDQFLAAQPPNRTKRLRQAVGVLVRMIMEARGWHKTGRKGSLGVRTTAANDDHTRGLHNTGGLAFWFLRAERYERAEGMPFESVRERSHASDRTAAASPRGTADARPGNGRQATDSDQ